MSIPTCAELYAPIEDAMTKFGGTITLCALYKELKDQFKELTEEDLNRVTPSGSNWWKGYVRFALDQLKRQGRVVRLARGIWGVGK